MATAPKPLNVRILRLQAGIQGPFVKRWFIRHTLYSPSRSEHRREVLYITFYIFHLHWATLEPDVEGGLQPWGSGRAIPSQIHNVNLIFSCQFGSRRTSVMHQKC